MKRQKYRYIGGTIGRPNNLTTNDIGYEYFDIEKNVVSFWNGAEWVELSSDSQEELVVLSPENGEVNLATSPLQSLVITENTTINLPTIEKDYWETKLYIKGQEGNVVTLKEGDVTNEIELGCDKQHVLKIVRINGEFNAELIDYSPEGSAEENEVGLEIEQKTGIYKLTPSYETGVDAQQDTNLIKEAISYCKLNNIGVLLFPSRQKFLVDIPHVSHQEGWFDNNVFNIHSNFTIDLNGSTIELTPNDSKNYEIFIFDEDCRNSTLKNGTLIGEKDEHDFTKGNSEGGLGVVTRGFNNTVKNMHIYNMMGDGVYMTGLSLYTQKRLNKTHFEFGEIDFSNGEIINTSQTVNKVSNVDIVIDDFIVDRKNHIRALMHTASNELTKGSSLKMAFYKEDGSFIKATSKPYQSEYEIPEEAYKIKLGMLGVEENDITVILVEGNIGLSNRIEDCKIHDCRRQGISIAYCIGSEVISNEIYNIAGTDPQCGIDIEDSGLANFGTLIENNYIHDTVGGNIVACDSWSVTVRRNRLYNLSSTGGGRITLGTSYCEGLTVEDNMLCGVVSVGKKNPLGRYRYNIFNGNTIKPPSEKEVSHTFYNCVCESNYFENGAITFRDCNVVNCRFLGTLLPSGGMYVFTIGGNSIFSNCQFVSETKILNSDKIKVEGNIFETCYFKTPNLATVIFDKKFETNTTETQTLTLEKTGESTGLIKSNTFKNSTQTGMNIRQNCNSIQVYDNKFPSISAGRPMFSIHPINATIGLFVIERNEFNPIHGNNKIIQIENSQGDIITADIINNNIISTLTLPLLTLTATLTNPEKSLVYFKNNRGNFTIPSKSIVHNVVRDDLYDNKEISVVNKKLQLLDYPTQICKNLVDNTTILLPNTIEECKDVKLIFSTDSELNLILSDEEDTLSITSSIGVKELLVKKVFGEWSIILNDLR